MKDEALRMALEALEAHADIGIKSDKAITAIKQALEQPEERYIYGTPLLDAFTKPAPVQEPVAWRWSESKGERWFDWTTDWSHHDKAKLMAFPIEYAYTTQPAAQRQWVGLTDEEREKIALEVSMDAVCITEAKLKELNEL